MTKPLRPTIRTLALVLLASCAGESVAPPVPTNLAFSVQPTSSIAGTTIGPLLIAVRDASGNTITSATTSVTVALTASNGATLLGTVTRNAVNGVATFNDLRIEKAGSSYTLVASASTLTNATSAAFDIGPASATQLVVLSQPTDVKADVSNTLRFALQDPFGNMHPTQGAQVTLALASNPGGATLDGQLTRPIFEGTVTFSVRVTKPGSGYTIVATSAPLTSATTNSFNVSPGDPVQLVFTSQPTTATSNAPITPTLSVNVVDTYQNLVPTAATSVSVSIGFGTGTLFATLGGTKTKSAVNGVVSFNDLTIDSAGTAYTLFASAAGVSGTYSQPFDVMPGPAARLTFTVQPSPTTTGAVIAPAVRVTVEDAAGNTVGNAPTTVTLAIGLGAFGANLSGTLTRQTVSGTATFDDLAVDLAYIGYTLVASATGLTSGQSNQFAVVAASPGSVSKVSRRR